MMDRRQFLLQSALGTAALAIRPRRVLASARERILVIGAGMAGISAARRLVDRGFEVTILEARSEPGGRIRQDSSFGVKLDLGAQFITTSVGNPLTGLATQFGAETYPVDDDEMAYAGGERKFFDAQSIEVATRSYGKFRSRLAAEAEELDKDVPVETFLREHLENVEKEKGSAIAQLVHFLAVSDISGDYAADPADYSARYFEADMEFSGPDLLVKSGYRVLIDGLARGLDIKTGITVQTIDYSRSGVAVSTSNGAFEADRAIVTLPLGVLKRGSVEFSPPLPARKKQAIERLGMGLLDKLYLKFPRVFWQNSEGTLGYVGNVPSLNGREYPDFYFLDRMLEQPIMLLFAGGSQARSFEARSAEECVSMAMTPLKRMFGSKIPEPEQFLRTSWEKDPFTFGSYSFPAVNSTPGDYDAIAAPAGDRLFFAGEASSRDYPASVHGAYLSGIREAERIAALPS